MFLLTPDGIAGQANKKDQGGQQHVVEITGEGNQSYRTQQYDQYRRKAAQCDQHRADDAHPLQGFGVGHGYSCVALDCFRVDG